MFRTAADLLMCIRSGLVATLLLVLLFALPGWDEPVAADSDNDGHVDLFVAGIGRNILYHNRGDGTFEDVTQQAGIKSGPWSIGAAWFDYDNDGLLDLFVVNYVQWSPEFDRFCGDASRPVRVYCHPQLFDGLS